LINPAIVHGLARRWHPQRDNFLSWKVKKGEKEMATGRNGRGLYCVMDIMRKCTTLLARLIYTLASH